MVDMSNPLIILTITAGIALISVIAVAFVKKMQAAANNDDSEDIALVELSKAKGNLVEIPITQLPATSVGSCCSADCNKEGCKQRRKSAARRRASETGHPIFKANRVENGGRRGKGLCSWRAGCCGAGEFDKGRYDKSNQRH